MKRSGSNSNVEESGETTLPLSEEHLHIEKQRVRTETVRVHTKVDLTHELVSQDLKAERVTVKRVPVDRYVEVAPQIKTEGDLTIIPVLEEVLIFETKLLLKEEIHLQRTVETETVTKEVPIRKQRVEIESDP
jgi:stress response protein YsnF